MERCALFVRVMNFARWDSMASIPEEIGPEQEFYHKWGMATDTVVQGFSSSRETSLCRRTALATQGATWNEHFNLLFPPSRII